MHLDGVKAEWTAPSATITGYDVQYREWTGDNLAHWTTHAGGVTGTTTTIAGLEAERTWQVRVRARNGEGPSEWSAPGSAKAKVPGKPSALSLTAGDRQLAASWTAPADNSAPITD